MLTASNAGPIPRLSWFQVYSIDAPLRLSANPPISRSARPFNPGSAWTAASRLSLLGHRAALHTSGTLALLPSKLERTHLAWMGRPQGSCTTRCPSVTGPEQPPHVVRERGRSLVSPLVTRCWGCPSVRFPLGHLLTTEVPLLSWLLLSTIGQKALQQMVRIKAHSLRLQSLQIEVGATRPDLQPNFVRC